MSFPKWMLLLVLVFSETLWAIDCGVKAERRFEDWSPAWLSTTRDGVFTPLVMQLTDWFGARKTSLAIESMDPRCESAAKVLGTRQWDGEIFLEFTFPDFPFKYEGKGTEKFVAPAPVGKLIVEYRETEGNAFRVLKTQRIALALKCDGAFSGERQESLTYAPAVYGMRNYPDHCTFSAKNAIFETVEGAKLAVSLSGGVTKQDAKAFSFRIDRLEVR